MIELKDFNGNDLLKRTFRIVPVVPPVFKCSSTQQQFVDEVVLVFHKANSEPWKLYDVRLVGDRQLKSGERGHEVKVSRPYVGLYGEIKEQPDWLTEIVNFFTPEV